MDARRFQIWTEIDDCSTGEHQLWMSVLNTFVTDMRKARSDARRGCIIREARTRWIYHLCTLIGLDFSFFIQHLGKIASGEIKKFNKASRSGGTREEFDSFDVPVETSNTTTPNPASGELG